jgi:signal recognition particle subunit SEC65
VQKVGAKVYEALKETKNNGNLVEGYKTSWTFSEIVDYGEENVFTDAPEKIQQFSRELDYKTLSDQTYSGLFKKHGEKYAINKDKVAMGVSSDDLRTISEQKIYEVLEKQDKKYPEAPIKKSKAFLAYLAKPDQKQLDDLTKLLGQHRGFNSFGETKSTQILNQFLNAEKKGR